MNKNTKQFHVDARKAHRRGQSEFSVNVPITTKGNAQSYYKKTIAFAPRGSNVISESPARNMQQKVLCNTAGGAGSSATVHVLIDETRPVRYKNHGQYKDFKENYKQPKTIAA